jgi:protein SCO1/2
MRLRVVLATIAVITAGVATFAAVTDGFRAATSEAAWRLAVAEWPHPLPDATLVDQSGRAFRLSALRGRPVLIEFFYTSCPAICGLLASQFQAGFERLIDEPEGPEVLLLSVSFDPERDTAMELADYAARLGVDGRIWRVARASHSAELQSLLDAFGVVVLMDGAGGFIHNAAIYLVDAEGRLARIYDPDAAERAIAELGG